MIHNRHPVPRGMHWPQPNRRNPNPFGGFGRPFDRNPPNPFSRPQSNRGLLSSLFQKQSAPHAASMFAKGTQPSLLQNLTNPQTVSQFLGQAQNVLNTAQQLGPLIQQYGPIIKNLPAMWKIYQGLQAASNEEQKEPSSEGVIESSDNLVVDESEEKDEVEVKNTPKTQRARTKKTGESVPKLYIP